MKYLDSTWGIKMLRNVRNSVLNWKFETNANMASALYPGGLDKRDGSSSFAQTISDTVDSINTVTDMFSRALGVKAPYLTIGEVPAGNWLGNYSSALGAIGGAVRAVQNIVDKDAGQEGVIIDCLGDVTGDSSVEFTSNPLMYVTNGVIDSRVRVPATVSATIGISNYLADNILGDLENTVLNSFGAAGSLVKGVVNQLVNGGQTRAQAALYRLRWLMENGKPFTVYTPHGIYENMLIKSIKPRTTDQSMDMLFADIEFKEAIMYTIYRQSDRELKDATTPPRVSITGESNYMAANKFMKNNAVTRAIGLWS